MAKVATKRSNTRNSTADKRTSILRAATRVFARNGYFNSKVADIARAADVADGTVYLYFKSKEEILHSIFDQNIADAIAAARRLIENVRDPREKLLTPPSVPPQFSFLIFCVRPAACVALGVSARQQMRRLQPLGDSIEIDFAERVADQRAAIGLGETPRLQRFHHAVEPLEIVGVHGDANHLVVGRFCIALRRGLWHRFGWRWSAAGVKAVLKDASDVLLRALRPKVCSFAHRSTPPAHGWITEMRCPER